MTRSLQYVTEVGKRSIAQFITAGGLLALLYDAKPADAGFSDPQKAGLALVAAIFGLGLLSAVSSGMRAAASLPIVFRPGAKQDTRIASFMYDWLKNGGRVVIVSRDMTWLTDHPGLPALLEQKATAGELELVLPNPTDVATALQAKGAVLHCYSGRTPVPKVRFTFTHFGQSGTRVALGRRDGPNHVVRILSHRDGVSYDLAEDLLNTLRRR